MVSAPLQQHIATPAAFKQEEGEYGRERDSPADTKASEEEEEGSPGVRAEIPVKTMVRCAVPQQPTGIHSRAETPLQPLKDPSC